MIFLPSTSPSATSIITTSERNKAWTREAKDILSVGASVAPVPGWVLMNANSCRVRALALLPPPQNAIETLNNSPQNTFEPHITALNTPGKQLWTNLKTSLYVFKHTNSTFSFTLFICNGSLKCQVLSFSWFLCDSHLHCDWLKCIYNNLTHLLHQRNRKSRSYKCMFLSWYKNTVQFNLSDWIMWRSPD